MKLKINYPIFAFLVVLLASASFVTAVDPPNTNFSTGDQFHFTSFSERDEMWNNKEVQFNPDDDTDIYYYQENWNNGFTTTNGVLELFLVKPDANLPAFTGPDGDFDHILLIDFWGMSVDPSNRSSGDKLYDADESTPQWYNNTYPVENTAGRYEGNDKDGDEWMPVVSNETYLIQMSEITDSTIDFQEMDWLSRDLGLESFDIQVPLQTRSVTPMPSMPFTINGVEQIIDTNYLTSTFEINYPDEFTTWIEYEAPNEQGYIMVEVNATLNIWVYQSFSYYFDATTGMLLEMSEIRNFAVDLKYTNSSLINPREGPSPMAISSEILISSLSSNVNTIDEASSFYGNARPVSSGTNRIEAGDLITYELESEYGFWMENSMSSGDASTLGFDEYSSNWADHDSYGTMNFDVYRHQPGSFDAIIFSEGESTETWGYDYTATVNGETRSDYNETTSPPREFMDFDEMSFQSSTDEEIVHFFENSMHFEDDFLYDEGDGWRLNYNRELPMVGPVNDTAFHMDFESDETLWINGFEHTWFNVQMYGQEYGTSYNELVSIPLWRDERGEAWLDVTLTGDAKGEIAFYYDSDTGVLLAHEQRMDVNLFLDGSGTVMVWDDFTDTEIPIVVEFHMSISIDQRRFMLLSDHPNKYLTAEAADPDDHTTPVDTTPVDTTTSEAAPGLDLPISVPSVLIGIIAIPVLIRFKKKLR